VLLLGVPGTGKSAMAKALGNETGRPTLVLDIGALMGSLVGSTEANVRQALRIIVVGTLSPWDSKRATWKDIAVESRRTSPADTAAFRLDFQTWLKTWNRRHRKIIAMLGAGYRTLTVARKLGVSAARVSQFRRQYQQSWEQFQTAETAMKAA